jgi:SOS-response transcriptional repressor LexA
MTTKHDKKLSGAGARLRSLIDRSGLSFRELARRAGYSHGSGVGKHVYGATGEYLALDVSVRLADALQGLGDPPIDHTEAVRILSGRDAQVTSRVRARSHTHIAVVGSVQAGLWRAAAQADEHRSVPYVAPPAYRQHNVVAFEVSGHSMDRVFPHGSTVICVSYDELGREPRPGERVIVQRYRHDEVEATCKELALGPHGLELRCLSSRPEFQTPLPVKPVAGEHIQITHRVIAAIVLEPL